MNLSKIRVFVSAGEVSGDKYASYILDSCKELIKDKELTLEAWGMGGSYLKNHMEIIQDSTNMGIVGIVNIIKHLPFFWQLENKLKKLLLERQPDIALLVDYPGLNLRLAKFIRKHIPHCKITYFVAPQVWAWNKKRINLLPKIIDRLLVILPFEEKLHKDAGTSARYVGNPSAYILQSRPPIDKNSLYEKYNLDKNKKTIAIFPGSRNKEIKCMLPMFLQAAQDLIKLHDSVQFVMVQAPSIQDKIIKTYFDKHKIPKDLIKVLPSSENYNAMEISDIGWLKSGTNTLECACTKTPLILGYKGSFLNWILYLILRRINYIGLPNIIANDKICPELLQNDCISKNWVDITNQWLSKPEILKEQSNKIQKQVLEKLNSQSSSPFQEVAKEIIHIAQANYMSLMNKSYVRERAPDETKKLPDNPRQNLRNL